MEDKQWVQHHIPDASCSKMFRTYFIHGTLRKADGLECFGIGDTEELAWEDAKNELYKLL